MLSARIVAPACAILALFACDPDKDPGADTGSVDTPDTGDTETDLIDNDGDGYAEGLDCDDSDPAVNPGADEVCDGADNDCDGLTDDEDDSVDYTGATTYYPDGDGDGYGGLTGAPACTPPAGTTVDTGDCNDADAAINPFAQEVCDELDTDEDCDGLIDGDDDSVDLSGSGATYYADVDGDTYGDASSGTLLCEWPKGWVMDSTDCDDADGAVYPGAPELCNDADDDCNPSVTESDTAELGGVVYTDLQDALDAAADGDTITLCDGTFIGAFTVPDNVSLYGFKGAADTILETDGSGDPILTLEGAVSVTDLTFRNGSAITGGAIDGYTNTPVGDVSIDACTFDSNVAVYGGAVIVEPDNALSVVDSTFTANFAAGTSSGDYVGSGGAIYAGAVDIQGSIFSDNSTLYGGALFLSGGTSTIDAASSFSDNLAGTYTKEEGGLGGALFANEADVVMDSGVDISGNTAYFSGGGLYCLDCTAEGGTFDANEATWGGGVNVSGDSTVSGATMTDNSAAYGGGMYANGGGTDTIALSDLTFETNTASSDGGGLFLYELPDGTVSSSTFDGNEATQYGGGLSAYTDTIVTLDGCDIYDNVAASGGGLHLSAAAAVVSSSTVEANTASDGGGGAFLEADALLESDSSDWGSTTTDNDPDDVYLSVGEEAYSSYGAAASFDCDDTTCE